MNLIIAVKLFLIKMQICIMLHVIVEPSKYEMKKKGGKTRKQVFFSFALITLIQSDNVTHSQTHSSLVRLLSSTARAESLKIVSGLRFR